MKPPTVPMIELLFVTGTKHSSQNVLLVLHDLLVSETNLVHYHHFDTIQRSDPGFDRQSLITSSSRVSEANTVVEGRAFAPPDLMREALLRGTRPSGQTRTSFMDDDAQNCVHTYTHRSDWWFTLDSAVQLSPYEERVTTSLPWIVSLRRVAVVV